jgi:hypothetical protein
MLNLCYDRLLPPNVGHPNLAVHLADPYSPAWRQFDHHWPRTVPLRLLLYLKNLAIPYRLFSCQDDFDFAWYPIALSWFDHGLDYFSLLADPIKTLLRCNRSKVLFYYHEGDNPARIKQKLDHLCMSNKLPEDCYVFVSANSAARNLERFIYYPEHESFFGFVNREQMPGRFSHDTKKFDTTALVRTHKSWRAAVMSDLYRSGLLANSIWSYDTDTVLDHHDDNAIEVASDMEWHTHYHDFLRQGPYITDTTDDNIRNDHHWVNQRLYQDSYLHIVLETHFDADQSGGTFLTEKTFKVLKFGQPFVIAGPCGSLQALRDMGYRTMDHCIDNRYDEITHNTDRWRALKNSISDFVNSNMSLWASQCRSDVMHNQELFGARQRSSVEQLLINLATYSDIV